MQTQNTYLIFTLQGLLDLSLKVHCHVSGVIKSGHGHSDCIDVNIHSKFTFF